MALERRWISSPGVRRGLGSTALCLAVCLATAARMVGAGEVQVVGDLQSALHEQGVNEEAIQTGQGLWRPQRSFLVDISGEAAVAAAEKLASRSSPSSAPPSPDQFRRHLLGGGSPPAAPRPPPCDSGPCSVSPTDGACVSKNGFGCGVRRNPPPLKS